MLYLLQEGWLPVSQRHAIVRPIVKKDGLDPGDTKNYRPVSNPDFFVEINWAYGVSTINCLLGETRSFAKVTVRIPRKSFNRDCSSQVSLRYIDGCWHWNGLASRLVGHVSSIWHCQSWYSDFPSRDIIRHHGHGSRLTSVLPDETNTTGCFQRSFIIQGHSRLWRSAGISPGTNTFPPFSHGRYPFNCSRAPYWSSLLRRRWATLPVRKGWWGGINDLPGHGMQLLISTSGCLPTDWNSTLTKPSLSGLEADISVKRLTSLPFSSVSAKLNSNPMLTTLEWL